MKFKALLPAACFALVLSACGESDVTVNYKVSSPVDIELYAESYFATIDLKGEEQMGTITAAYVDMNFSSSGDTLVVKREYKMDKSRGYLKNYMWRRVHSSTKKALGCPACKERPTAIWRGSTRWCGCLTG